MTTQTPSKPYSPGAADLISAAEDDGVVRWSTPYEIYEDSGIQAVRTAEIYLTVPGEDSRLLCRIEGCEDEYCSYTEPTRRRRRFSVDGVRFCTEYDGHRVWTDHDYTAWTVADPDPTKGPQLVKLVEAGALPPEDAYTELRAAAEEGGGDRNRLEIQEVWSVDQLSRVLDVWARAFTGVDVEFRFEEAPGSQPTWVRKLEEVVADAISGEESGEELIPGCRTFTTPKGALHGERAVPCVKPARWRNPDGTRSCEAHAASGAEPVSSAFK